jgi:phospholipid/cholesterol/gamma-HCH transport system ATP-binding protein
MGPSGTGKTTLLKLIGGQLFPEQGSIMVDGNNVHRLRRTELYNLRKRMGMLFQSGALLTGMSVFDNVAFPLREHTHLPESMIRTLVLMKLQAVGLRGARTLMPNELSGGMARRYCAGSDDDNVRRTLYRPGSHFQGGIGSPYQVIE